VVILAGVILWLKVAWPGIQKERAAADARKREQQIESFVQSVVAESGAVEPGAPANGKPASNPQRLRITPLVSEVQQALGAPDTSMTDFRGGQHLTWMGTRHKLTASFNQGRLYALTLTDVPTGRGMRVFESSAQWQEF
jgi:hypothetical protein